MSTETIKNKCIICDDIIKPGMGVYVQSCVLTDKKSEWNGRAEKFKDNLLRIVYQCKSNEKHKKVKGVIHIDCWSELIENRNKKEIEYKNMPKKDRLKSIE